MIAIVRLRLKECTVLTEVYYFIEIKDRRYESRIFFVWHCTFTEYYQLTHVLFVDSLMLASGLSFWVSFDS